MRSSFTSMHGAPLRRTLNVRQQTARRLAMVLGAMLALALGSALIGAVTAQDDVSADGPHTGPLSYLSEQ